MSPLGRRKSTVWPEVITPRVFICCCCEELAVGSAVEFSESMREAEQKISLDHSVAQSSIVMSLDDKLDALLKQSQQKLWAELSSEEVSHLTQAFLPTQSADTHSKAYLVLSAACQHIRGTVTLPKGKGTEESDPATKALVKLFAPSIRDRFRETNDDELITAVSFFIALFQVDWQSAAAIFLEDSTFESLMDILDLTPSKELAGEIARLLAQASAHKSCRERIISSDLQGWLERSSRQTSDTSLRSASAVALIKLSRGTAEDTKGLAATNSEPSTSSSVNEMELASLMQNLVVSGDDSSAITNAVEGLAYMSIEPQIKETLSKDTAFLSRLFNLIPRPKKTQALSVLSTTNTAQVYGIAVIISNICSYRPRLSQEQEQIAKLRQMANNPSPSGLKSAKPITDPLDDDSRVKGRCRRMVDAGVGDVLSGMVRVTDGKGVYVNVARAILGLVEDKENRGKLLQGGCSRALITIIRSFLPSATTPAGQVEESVLDAIQALAKFAITASPLHVFGPDQGSTLDAIRPFSILLLHPSSSLLQQFEALMALTNLSSTSPEASTRISKSEGLMNKVEFMLLDDNQLVQRASMELICNLIAGSEEVFDKYGGQEETAGPKSKLQVLIALSDAEDSHTRLAASGALATITSSPNACKALYSLQMERHRVLPILAQLIDPTSEGDDIPPDPASGAGLLHRGVVCTRNFLTSLGDESIKALVPDAKSSGLAQGLVKVVKSNAEAQNMSILQPAAEALKRLYDHGAVTF